MSDTYKIVRFHRNGPNETIVTGLTLKQAKEYCSNDATRGKDWFDGFVQEEN
jgi:hypothetical protein